MQSSSASLLGGVTNSFDLRPPEVGLVGALRAFLLLLLLLLLHVEVAGCIMPVLVAALVGPRLRSSPANEGSLNVHRQHCLVYDCQVCR